jgi:signal peptidase II
MKNLKYSECIIFFSVLLIDQLSKYLIEGDDYNSPLISLYLVPNHGVFSGFLSGWPHFIRVVFLSTLSIYIIGIYLGLIYFIRQKKLNILNYGLTILVAATFGNVMDRIRLGFVQDFIHLHLPILRNYIFNLSDLFIVISVFLISITIIKNHQLLWHPQEKRYQSLINKKFQVEKLILLNFALTFFFFSLLAFSFSYLKTYLPETLSDSVFKNFIYGYLIIWFTFSVVFSFFIVSISQRISGPIYALQNYIHQKNWNNQELKLRNDDFHKDEIEDIANTIKRELDKQT